MCWAIVLHTFGVQGGSKFGVLKCGFRPFTASRHLPAQPRRRTRGRNGETRLSRGQTSCKRDYIEALWGPY